MGKLEGQVAFITGAARGQGRSHAVRLAREGADIIAVDICAQISSVSYPMSTPADLAQTVKEVEAEGRRIVARQADVRDVDGLRNTLEEGIAEVNPSLASAIRTRCRSRRSTSPTRSPGWCRRRGGTCRERCCRSM